MSWYSACFGARVLHRRYLTWASVGFALVTGPVVSAFTVTSPLAALTQVQDELPRELLTAEPHLAASKPIHSAAPRAIGSDATRDVPSVPHGELVTAPAAATEPTAPRVGAGAANLQPAASSPSSTPPLRETRRLLLRRPGVAGSPLGVDAHDAVLPAPSATTKPRLLNTLPRATASERSGVARGQYVSGALDIELPPPRCEGVYVYIVSDWGDGEGMATMALGKGGKGYPKRVGARIGQYQVAAIGPSAYGLGPAVWLDDGDQLCQAVLFDDNPVRKKRYAKQKVRKNKQPKKAKKKRKVRRSRARR